MVIVQVQATLFNLQRVKYLPGQALTVAVLFLIKYAFDDD